MNILSNINIITILIIGIFLMPLLTGLLYPITSNRILHSLLSVLNSFKLILGIILAFYFVKSFFAEKQSGLLLHIYKLIPSIENLISRYSYDIIAYIIILFISSCIILWILTILTIPLYKYLIVLITDRFSYIFDSMSNNVKKILSVAWHFPKSICMVLIFSLLLNFYCNFINNPSTTDYINNSTAYQIINNNIFHPILNTNIAKNLPILINSSLKKAAEDFTPANNDNGQNPNYWKVPIIKYFNGMTLDEAVKSTSEIDNMARKIVGTEKNDKVKAYLLYDWITKNIQYDKDKAKIIVKTPSHVNSGAIVTFTEKKGVCFDYSCLYVAMCRAVGLKVRLVTGLASNGVEWGDHSWNQVYYPEDQLWINVDTTFGNSRYNYFDNSDYSTNHKYDVIQCEW